MGIQVIHTGVDSVEYIIGKVTGQSRVLGFVTYVMKQPIGIALIVMVPCAIIIILEIVKIVNVFGAERKQKIKEDNKTKELLTIFNEKKKSLNKDLQIAKINLYNQEIIREYLSCEQELNFIIIRFNQKLNKLIDKKGCR